jgi:hypothetical protein
MKPDVAEAMAQLIGQIRLRFPFGRADTQLCAGPCQGCSLKLLGYLETELDAWEARLGAGERPGLAEFSQLLRTARKIGRVLDKSGLMQLPEPTSHNSA